MITFDFSGNAITFERDPEQPTKTLGFIQPSPVSTGAEYIGRDYYVKDDIIPVKLPAASKAEKDLFYPWWRDVVRGMARQFTYTDPDGVSVTVRFNSPRLPEIRERAPGYYSISMTLRVC